MIDHVWSRNIRKHVVQGFTCCSNPLIKTSSPPRDLQGRGHFGSSRILKYNAWLVGKGHYANILLELKMDKEEAPKLVYQLGCLLSLGLSGEDGRRGNETAEL